jgi:hypothetical protein
MKDYSLFLELFGIQLSPWESLIVAACYLSAKPIDADAFEEGRAKRLKSTAKRLEALPSYWSRELCFEVLNAAHN